ncbi:MAG: hypothetical protein Q8R18_00900 [bacterium]|nr:hypothetical protein [bacterium]
MEQKVCLDIDVFIAAICVINKCDLATFNKKHFEHIQEIVLL